MRKLIRTPLTWFVIAEFLVVGVLITMAWNAVAGAARPVLASRAIPPADAAVAPDSPLPDFPALVQPSTGPVPGLNLSGPFWRARLAQLNQDQVYFEQLEWQVVHTALEAAQRYVQDVVVPALERAEGKAQMTAV